MKCSRSLIRICLFLIAAAPAYCQRGTVGVDLGHVSDKFAAQKPLGGADFIVNGQLIVIGATDKSGGVNLVAGGELRLPSDTNNHASEFAGYVGPAFRFSSVSVGFGIQGREIFLPSSGFGANLLDRGHMLLFELPVFAKYTFGPGKRAFLQAQGASEFSPVFSSTAPGLTTAPDPTWDHGYTLRGSGGYVFGRVYVKATYESRYFKFAADSGNPGNLFNWRSNLAAGGIGFVF